MKHIFVFGVSLWPKKWEILGKHHETFDYVGHYGEQKRCVFSMNVRKSRASRKSRRTCCEFPDPGSGRMELPRLSGRTERAIATLGPGFDVHVVDRGSGIPVELWPVQLFFLPPPHPLTVKLSGGDLQIWSCHGRFYTTGITELSQNTSTL